VTIVRPHISPKQERKYRDVADHLNYGMFFIVSQKQIHGKYSDRYRWHIPNEKLGSP